MHSLKNNRGFTLVELLAVMVLFSIIAIFSISIITSSANQQVKQTTHNSDVRKLSFTLKLITKDVRRSVEFLPEETDDSIEPNITYYKLELEGNEEITYWLEDNEIIRSSSSQKETIAQNISEFTMGSGAISITTLDGKYASTNISLRGGKSENLKQNN